MNKTYTADQVKRMPVGTHASVVWIKDPSKRVDGTIIREGKKKVLRSALSGRIHKIKDYDGFRWEVWEA